MIIAPVILKKLKRLFCTHRFIWIERWGCEACIECGKRRHPRAPSSG